MKEIIGVIAVVICVTSLMYLSFMMGKNSAQKEIIERALKTNDIEIIIFGEKQL